ncbi:unnamed protein product [Amoebophrya sp. A25]|nr:unnamed protein product [Amoebophrya sp. A25]|eukprot:GSA25T00024543001.1
MQCHWEDHLRMEIAAGVTRREEQTLLRIRWIAVLRAVPDLLSVSSIQLLHGQAMSRLWTSKTCHQKRTTTVKTRMTWKRQKKERRFKMEITKNMETLTVWKQMEDMYSLEETMGVIMVVTIMTSKRATTITIIMAKANKER